MSSGRAVTFIATQWTVSFLPHATVGGGDQEHLQSQLLSPRAAFSWLAVPPSSEPRKGRAWCCQPVSAPELNLSAKTSMDRKKHWMTPALLSNEHELEGSQLLSPPHSSGVAPVTNSNTFPIEMEAYTAQLKTKNWSTEHLLIYPSAIRHFQLDE